jgi:hypothetical protein
VRGLDAGELRTLGLLVRDRNINPDDTEPLSSEEDEACARLEERGLAVELWRPCPDDNDYDEAYAEPTAVGVAMLPVFKAAAMADG